ncbi:hypothetical protein JGS22_003260 [Streptomyces sp. P38-E01]|uniref:Uncharacterized protein n=1 Tax=Streptomyces tardus TaxID=2780544 RepID=A0A949JBE1_9ACTN|nr:hypothetical protein [Streptomyces tardus]MBU7596681.1 hypothetical protein [Streptomyces tardus]
MSERDSALTERVTAVLAHGETLVARHEAGTGNLKPGPRFWQRPRVFPGQRMPGDRLANLGLGLLRVVGAPWNVVEALMERLMWNDGPRKGAVSGGWESEAGRLALAMRPRSRTGVSLNLVVTNSHYRLVYVQTAQIGSRVGAATECGWAADLSRISWVRDRGDIRGGVHEIGFPDGSWMTLTLASPGWSGFVKALPAPKLGHRDPLPVRG